MSSIYNTTNNFYLRSQYKAAKACNSMADRETGRNGGGREFKHYEILAKLGEGSFGQVFKVRDRLSSEVLVMKVIQINSCNPNDLNEKMNEINVLEGLRHPNVCKFRYFFHDSFQ